MCKLQTLILLVIAILDVGEPNVQNEFHSQPKLLNNDGSLNLKAAPDKNITLRLTGDAALHVNNVNLLDLLKKRSNARVQGTTETGSELSISMVSLQLKNLKRDIMRLTTRISNAENRTRTIFRMRRVRTFNLRLRRLLERINLIERNLNLDECQQQNPCKNGGNCYDLYKDYYCECTEAWSGKNCDEDIDECYIWAGSDLGCQNNGVCINTPGSYRCNCTNGFSGTHCRLRNLKCNSEQSAELCANGVCVNANNPLGYTCICNEGWSRNNLTNACTDDVNECESTRNPCYNECINLPGSFRCGSCPKGYSGDGITCFDVDECKDNNGGCSQLPLVQCINSEGSFHCGNCPPGWVGDGRTCTKAPSNSCDDRNICHPHARCTYISETVVCTCPPGWYGHGFGDDGCSTQMTDQICENHKCQNNGTCVVSGRGTRCACPLGYMGPLCEQPDACNSNPCQNGGTCLLMIKNQFRCLCPRGTTGTNCEILRTACGSIIYQESGELTYPPDGGNYEANERCAWIIRTGNTKVLNVTFSKFDLETDPECSKDWLQIHDGRSLAAQLIGRFCGNALPLGGNIVSSHQQLFLWFRSDNATNAGGLKMSWISQEHVCGGMLSLGYHDNGIIRSPGYPGKAPANRECEWNLNAPYGNRLILRFYEVNLGGDKNCSRDTLKVYDSDQLLESVCETSLPEPKHTSSNKARIHFHTDSYRLDSSFQMHYEVVAGNPYCGGYFTEHTGIFKGNTLSPVCLYLIEQPPGTRIKLEFTEFFLLKSRNCATQKIEVFDGKTDEAPLLKLLCGSDAVESIESTGNSMLVRYEYQLVGLDLPRTFEAKYIRICGERFFGPDSGIITTPNYPQPYFEHMTCTYDIYGPLDTVVIANFTDFSISTSTPYMPEEEDNTIGAPNRTVEVDEYMNYVDVYLSLDQKRRYYKGDLMELASAKNRMRIVFHAYDNKRKSRGLRVEFSFKRFNCGGVLTAMDGNFLAYGSLNGNEKYCEWVLEAPKGKSIQLNMKYFAFISQNAKSNISIYLNNTIGGDRLVASYSKEFRINREVFHSNVMTISFRTQILDTLRGNYSFIDDASDCGGNFTYRSGVIKSPDWPSAYPVDLDCTWVIAAPIGHKIELLIQNFSVETTSLTECDDDYLEIRNGKSIGSPLIGKYCGDSMPYRIPSFTNHLYLHFHSDSYIPDTGFYLFWEQTATGCGGKLNSHQGSIHSPHYPEVSAGPVVCTWIITVAEGSRITIKLTSASTIAELCRSNVLNIYDGATLTSRQLEFNCRSNQTITLKSTTNQVAVRYKLNANVEDGPQFLLDYETDCVQRIEDWAGVIESPNFPENYPPNMNCEWDLRGGRNNKISLSFSHLRLEKYGRECNYDHVTLIDMRDEEALRTQHLCDKLPEMLVTEGNRIILKFVSDYSASSEGFRVEFKRLGCGEHLRNDVGAIESPNAPYGVDIDCDWFIEAPAGKQIVLSISELLMETDRKDCTSDVFRVANDKSSDHYLTEECKVQQTALSITSMANTMYIHFHTSAIRERKYFKATYATKDSVCGGIIRARKGVITSPNYPGKYLPNTMCVWSIMPDDMGLHIDIETLNLPDSVDCNDTYLYVESDTKPGSRRWCGNYNNTLVYASTGSPIRVILKSGTLSPGNGFKIRFSQFCGSARAEASALLKSRMGDYCWWTISNPEGTLISLNIYHLECQNITSPTNSSLNFLQIRDVENTNATKFCSSHPANMNFYASHLLITARNINFRGRYSIIQSSCGGTLTSLNGILTSPYYPNTYPSNVECVWEIQATKGNFIEINFDFIGITSSEKCNIDFLEMRQTEAGKLIGAICGDVAPTETFTFGETVWLKFHSAEGSTGSGFRLRWNYAHTNSLNGTEGIIEPPPVYSIKNDVEPYVWRIDVARGSLIRLTFKEYNKGLELYDGFDETAIKIGIQYSPWEFTSGTNVLLLKTDNTEIEHFSIEWKAINKAEVEGNQTIAKCQQEIILSANAHVNISSEGYPIKYDNDLNCKWVVQTKDPTQHVVLNLYEAILESVPDCTIDYLRISTSSNLLNWHEALKICDSGTMRYSQPIAIIHGTPNLKMEFHTDSSITRSGFTSFVTAACGSNMTLPSGTIIWPTLMRSRVHNSECLWHIEVRSSKQIEFTFTFDDRVVKASEACRQYALIYDGIDGNAPLLEPGQICNQVGRNVSRLLTTSNHALVKYNMTWSYGERVSTWNLTYREFSECGDEIHLSDGTGVSRSSPRYPNIPHPHTECSWLFVAPAGETLQVDFIEPFDMSVRYCDKEYVELFDGSSPLSRSLGRFCRFPPTLYTSGNVLYMHYLTDIAEPRMGFRAQVKVSTCGGTVTAHSGAISSYDYPAPGGYSEKSSCEYVIKLPIYLRVKLNFTDLDLFYDNSSLDSNDYLEIFLVDRSVEDGQGNNLLVATIFGNASTPVLELDSNIVLIRIRSFKQNHEHRGFKIKYDANPGLCYKDVTGESGIFQLGDQRSVIHFMICRWRITVPKGQRVRIEFPNLEQVPAVQIPLINVTSTRQYLHVPSNEFSFSFYNSHDMVSKITEFNLRTYNASEIIQSSDNLMYVRFQIGYDTPRKNIIVKYTSSEESLCPNDISDDEDSGQISLKQLIDTNANFYCESKFTLSGTNETIAFKINEFQIVLLNNYITNGLRFKDASEPIAYKTIRDNVTNTIVSMTARRGSVGILQTESIRILKFEATFRRHPCGGQFTLEDGLTIASPELIADDKDYGGIDCLWVLNAGSSVNIYWLSANKTQFTHSCEEEYVAVYASPKPETGLMAKICRGKEQFNATKVIGLYTTIVYHSSYYNRSSGFRIVVQKAMNCNDEKYLRNFDVSTLNFPAKLYKNNMECVWEYVALHGFYLSLGFVGRFFIEDSTNCTKDYLEVQHMQDDSWLTTGRYCGRDAPAAQNFSTARIRLIFRSDENITAEGFTAQIQLICHTIFNVARETKEIIMPNFNQMNIMNLHCEFTLLSGPDELINVHIIDKSPNKRCEAFSITAYKRSENNPKEIVEGEKYCTEAEFRVESFVRLEINAIYSKDVRILFELDGCGGAVNRPTVIRSLADTTVDHYADDMNCIWNVTAPEGHAIVVKFKHFVMEHNGRCMYDYVEIYAGAWMNEDKRISKLCGNLTDRPPMINVDSNRAIIVAKSDDSVSYRGFLAEVLFTPNCNERITLTDGNSPVTLVRHLTVNGTDVMMCNYRIMAPNGYRVRLDMRDLQLSTPRCSSSSCEDNCNYIEIFNSVQEQRASMGKYCTDMSRSNVTVRSSNEDAVVLVSASQLGTFSFEIVLEMEASACGSATELTIDGNEINIIFPQRKGNNNALELYPPNTHCTWHITSNGTFDIKFKSFSLQNVSDVTGKCLDYVHLRSIYLSRYICGSATGFDMTVSRIRKPELFLTFHSDGEVESTGFHLVAVQRRECNRSYTASSGMIKYENMDTIQVCYDDIHVPEGYWLNIVVPSFYINADNCTKQFLRIIDMKRNNTLLQRCRNQYETNRLLTITNSVRVERASSFFRLFYWSTKNSSARGCGGEVFSSEGELASPPYDSDRNLSECRWDIVVPVPNRIRLMFNEFDMGSSVNCLLDFVTIIEVQENNNSEKVGKRYCGQILNPTDYISENSHIAIFSRKTPNFDGTGWVLSFELYDEATSWNPSELVDIFQ